MDKINIYKLDVLIYGQAEKITDTLSKTRVRIFYKGLNRNRTFISEEFAEQLIATLPYTPIKGIFSYTDVDYEDHGYDNTDGRIYGIVPENPNFAWEKHLDNDGVEREYATADVYLFTGLYPEAKLVQGKPQSMEIFKDTVKGEWRTWEDGMPYYHFIEGGLIGLQILGDKVEPCFEGAAFFSLYQNYLKNNNTKEGEKMDKKILEIFRLSDNENASKIFNLLNPKYTEEGNWTIENIVVEIAEDYAIYTNKDGCIKVAYTITDGEVALGETSEITLAGITSEDVQAYEALKTENQVNLDKVLELTSSIEELNSSLEQIKTVVDENKQSYEKSIGEYEQKISDLESEKVRLETEKSDIELERNELQNFKTQKENQEKEAIIEEFSSHFTDEQIQSYRDKMNDFSIVDFKKEICMAAYEADPTIFQAKTSLIYTGGNDSKEDENVLVKAIKKYRNGGNK